MVASLSQYKKIDDIGFVHNLILNIIFISHSVFLPAAAITINSDFMVE
jgi:hypothetical protein